MASDSSGTAIAVVGDLHGHLQLALCVLARWQEELKVNFEAVLLCGDVGTFTDERQLDNATRRHGKVNPCELEFLRQWSTDPQAPWLSHIFRGKDEDGLGLICPVVMVHGNHEGFEHLAGLVAPITPKEPVGLLDLPSVDTNGYIRLLPSGWRAVTPAGTVIAGIGGIQRDQRRADYHDMAYIDEEAVLELRRVDPVDILITHQGPSETQGDEAGSETLQALLDEGVARVWFHGHTIVNSEAAHGGRTKRTLVVPLDDVAFPGHGTDLDNPGTDGWAIAHVRKDKINVSRETPPFLREFRRHRWTPTPDGDLVCPPLAAFAWRSS